MLLEPILFAASLASCVGTLGYLAALKLLDEDAGRLRARLRGSMLHRTDSERERADRKPLIVRIGLWAASPFMPKTKEKQTAMRRDLAKAGIYSASAGNVLAGMKFVLLLGGLLLGYLLGAAFIPGGAGGVLGFASGGLVGYMLPQLWLKSSIGANQKSLNQGLPDALDLMVVCVEAGLTIDSAMQRVGDELALAHPTVSREMGITHMETQIGVPRAEALKNLGVRTDNKSLQGLSAMLIQAERFGTSIGTALRIHAESMRDARHHIAEELAAKASVKMSFPLVLFIFPATFIVLAGPTVLQLFSSNLFD